MCHFFTQVKFLEFKIYTEKTRKLHSKLPIFRKLHSKLPIFRVKSVKIYTGQKKNYTGAARGARENMRYARPIR